MWIIENRELHKWFLKASIKPALTTVVEHFSKALGTIIFKQEQHAAEPSPVSPLFISDNRNLWTLAAPFEPKSRIRFKKKKRTLKKKNNVKKLY